jgi:hypothetical protein
LGIVGVPRGLPLARSSVPKTHSIKRNKSQPSRTPLTLDVTPVFPKKTKCITICMPESSFMHIVTYKCIPKQYHVKKEKDYQRFTLNPRNGGTKLHKQSTGGCVRLAPTTSSKDFRVASSF